MTASKLTDLEQALKRMEADGVTVHRCAGGDCSDDFLIHNARLHPRPYAVAIGYKPDHICAALRHMKGVDAPLTICSGGHHHEAMCSNTGGLVILSNPDEDFDVVDDGNALWVGAGQPLGWVIGKLAEHGRLLPTGACATVNVGGVTLGGGWGMSYRTYGLTVDALLQVEMILPGGEKVSFDGTEVYEGTLPEGLSPKELFWAVRGGGGGNFGVVTRFKFALYRPGPVFTEFRLQWAHADRLDIAEKWAELCETADEKLNLFARMTVAASKLEDKTNPAFIVGGRYYGEKAPCRAALDLLYRTKEPAEESYSQVLFKDPASFQRAMFQTEAEVLSSDGTPTLPPRGYMMQLGAPGHKKDKDTCSDEAQPHKVTSTLPKVGADARAVMKAAGDFIDGTTPLKGVNMYLSLHGMGGFGGADTRDPVAFPWRKRPYMLQLQAWWNEGDCEVCDKAVLAWVAKFRRDMGNTHLCEGGFINFPDESQKICEYYGDTTYRALKEIKHLVDPDRRLMFPMGIDPDDTCTCDF